MQHRVIRREEDRFRAADGVALQWRCWLPSDPRRVLVLVHGMAEHSGRYDAVGAWFATHDSAVHAYDHRGHGRSEGSLGRRDALSALVEDLASFVERLRKDYGELPIVLLGHSMGGLVVLRVLAERDLGVHAAITSGAALGLGSAVSPARARAARWIARVAPGLSIATGINPSALSRDPQTVRAYREDPLVRKRLPVALGASILSAMSDGALFAAGIRVPVLLLHGESDTLCPPQGSRSCRAVLAGSGHGLQIYPTLRHEILNEPERDRVLGDALHWIEERGL